MTNLDKFKSDIKRTSDPIKVATIIRELQKETCNACGSYNTCKQRIYGNADCIIGLVSYLNQSVK